MSSNSSNNGRAFEFAILQAFENIVFHKISAKIEENSSYLASKKAWGLVTPDIRSNLMRSAEQAVNFLINNEPLILDGSSDPVIVRIQSDNAGVSGDVRDILLSRFGDKWEIGISAKHNHDAVKHSRLGQRLDFSKEWFGVKCSKDYWDQVGPVFRMLEEEKSKGTKWRDICSKADRVYIPILNAFIDEIRRRTNQHASSVPQKMVEYLVGRYDYYKVISKDSKRCVFIKTFNLRGSLSKPGRTKKAIMVIPIAKLPREIIDIRFKPKSKTTVEIYFDKGWSFSFRIHSASTYVETSLKFDINFIGVPTTIYTIECKWQ